jgi:alkylation response protein AidB-like acyl-CoA dehydrogenase
MALDFDIGSVLAEVRESARRHFEPLVARRMEIQTRGTEDGSYPEVVWDALAQAGVLGGVVPQELGGTGLGVLGTAVALEELAARDVGNFLPVLTAMGAFAIARHGSPQLQRHFLPRIAAGDCRLCFAMTEAAAGFNIFRTQTVAARTGDAYVLTGQKTYISGADVADYMLVVARTKDVDACVQEGLGKTYGMSLFLVDAHALGIEKRCLPTAGVEGVLRQYAITFDEVRTPATHLVGTEHLGTHALLGCFNVERVLTAALALGASRYCLEIACAHARTRKVFGDTPIGRYQAIQHPLAEVLLRQEATRLVTHKAAWLLDGGADLEDAGLSANAAKLLSVELGLKAVDGAISALGGRGFEDASGLMRLWLAARLMKTSPISDELLLNFVAEHNLGLPRAT